MMQYSGAERKELSALNSISNENIFQERCVALVNSQIEGTAVCITDKGKYGGCS